MDMDKKRNPFQFTIRFSGFLPKHRAAAEFLNRCGRDKAQVIADAMELYFEKYGIPCEQSVGMDAMPDISVQDRDRLARKKADVNLAGNMPEAEVQNFRKAETENQIDVGENVEKTSFEAETDTYDTVEEVPEKYPDNNTRKEIGEADTDILIASIMGFENAEEDDDE